VAVSRGQRREKRISESNRERLSSSRSRSVFPGGTDLLSLPEGGVASTCQKEEGGEIDQRDLARVVVLALFGGEGIDRSFCEEKKKLGLLSHREGKTGI